MATILIIDDDPGIRGILRRAFEGVGHTVFEEGDGAAGQRRFAQVPVDLVVTDIIMPEREGVETIMEIHKQSPRTPIIAMSGGGGGGADYLEMATKLGATLAIPKPFSLAEMLDAVKTILARQMG